MINTDDLDNMIDMIDNIPNSGKLCVCILDLPSFTIVRMSLLI